MIDEKVHESIVQDCLNFVINLYEKDLKSGQRIKVRAYEE